MHWPTFVFSPALASPDQPCYVPSWPATHSSLFLTRARVCVTSGYYSLRYEALLKSTSEKASESDNAAELRKELDDARREIATLKSQHSQQQQQQNGSIAPTPAVRSPTKHTPTRDADEAHEATAANTADTLSSDTVEAAAAAAVATTSAVAAAAPPAVVPAAVHATQPPVPREREATTQPVRIAADNDATDGPPPPPPGSARFRTGPVTSAHKPPPATVRPPPPVLPHSAAAPRVAVVASTADDDEDDAYIMVDPAEDEADGSTDTAAAEAEVGSAPFSLHETDRRLFAQLLSQLCRRVCGRMSA
jgi:hypothetical protein